MSQPELTPAQEAMAQRLSAAIEQEAAGIIRQIARTQVATDDRSAFGATEFTLRDLALRIASRALEIHLGERKNGYQGSSVCCPRCDHAAGYHGDRPRAPLSLFGTPIRFWRAYYYCRRCGVGIHPFDEAAGLTAHEVTPAVERLSSLAGGVADSFEKGAALLREMAHVRLSESAVEDVTEGAGARLAAQLQEGRTLGPKEDWVWHPDAKGRLVAYFSLDATGVAQQGPGAAKAEGRMPYVGMILNPVQPGLLPPGTKPLPRMQARYISGLYPLAEMGPLLRRQGAQVGMGRADLWVALTDGGSGLEEFADCNFARPDLVKILDYWHATGYLEDLARAVYPSDAEAAAALGEEWCELLKWEGGAVTLAVLAEWGLPLGRPAVREAWERLREYFSNNLHRMEYPEYLAEGWCIGSGAVGSACKAVVGQRLKLAGMRWGEPGTHAVCHLRALYRSEKGQWDAFWERRFTKLNACSAN
jgi:hypothetical protein